MKGKLANGVGSQYSHTTSARDVSSITARAERDGTRAETRFRLIPKRTSPFKSVGASSSVDCWQPSCAHQLE